MRGAPITVRCECGDVRKLSYGESWRCERCGRIWNTTQIPEEEYWGLMREMRRWRLQVVGVAVGIVGVFGLLAAFVSESLFILAPVVLAAWFIGFMPAWRRRLRRRARNLPKWSLTPEER
jgi:hypothetical protein